MPAPTVGATSATGGNVSSLAIPKPSDLGDGGIALVQVSHRNTISVTSIPAGFVPLGSFTSGSSTLRHYYRPYDPGEAAGSYTFTLNAQERASGTVMSLWGAALGNGAADAFEDYVLDAGLTSPVGTTLGADRLVLHAFGVFHGGFGSTATLSIPVGTTLAIRHQTVNEAVEAVWEDQAVAGATTQRTATTNTSSGKTTGVLVIAPPPSTATPVGLDGDLMWSIAELAMSDAEVSWAVRAAAGHNAELVWAVRSLLVANADVRWSVAQAVSGVADVRWPVAAVTGQSGDLRWGVRATTVSLADLRWAVAELIGAPADVRWAVFGLGGVSGDLRWAVREVSGMDADIRWKVAAAVGTALRIRTGGSEGTGILSGRRGGRVVLSGPATAATMTGSEEATP